GPKLRGLELGLPAVGALVASRGTVHSTENPARLLAPWLLGLVAAAGCRPPRRPPPRRPPGPPPPGAPRPRPARYDVERYAIDLEILPERRRIEATCRILLWPRANPLASADFDLEDLDVSAVRDERGRALAFARTPGNLHVAFVEPVPPGRCVEVAVDYSGSPRRGLFFRADRDGVRRQVFTQGECEDSRGWFPCFDAPSDRVTSEIRVTMPARWTSVAAGERIERVEHDGLATELWR